MDARSSLIPAVLLLAAAPCALGAEGSTDYTVTLQTGLYEAPPASADTVGISPYYGAVNAQLPFSFPYFGIYYSQVAITNTGYIQFGVAAGYGQSQSASKLSGVTASDSWDGMCAACWDNLFNTHPLGSKIRTWTAGTAPNRRYVVSWENYNDGNVPGSLLTFQIRLLENAGKIQFAYKPDIVPTGWAQKNYCNGVVAPGADPRWTAVTTNVRQTGHPGTDFELTPRVVHLTGQLLFDRPIPTAAGIPAPTPDVPLSGVRLEMRYSTGILGGFGVSDAAGNFDVLAYPGPPAYLLDLHAVAASPACSVGATATSAPYSFVLASGLTVTADANLGTKRITAAADPSGALRGPLAIASAIGRAYAWADPLTTDAIPQLPVLWSGTDASPTAFLGNSLRIAGPQAGNPDTWDDPVVVREYGRHLVASAAGLAPGVPESQFDAITTEENALALAFGYQLASALTGQSKAIDAVSPSLATSTDLETPAIATPRRADVAGWVAAALYDALDPANEAHDRLDGSGAAATKIFQSIDAVGTAPTALKVFRAWALREDAGALSRIFVHHGVLSDDEFEPNDDAAEAADLGAAGVRRNALVLETNDEDWFSVTLDTPAAALLAEMSFARTTYVAGVQLEIYDQGGGLLVTKTDLTGLGPVIVATSAVPAGRYAVRIRHVQGDIVGAYTIQVLRRMDLDATSLKSWTLGRPYDDAIPLVGGVTPYAFTIVPGGGGIPGVALNPATLRASGTPTFKGTFDFTLSVQDAGSPPHTVQSSHHVFIAEPLDLPLAPYVGVAGGHAADVTLVRRGGTAPFVFEIAGGSLPAGLALDADAPRIRGTTTAVGDVSVTIRGTDVAGSTHDETVTCVVCPPAGTAQELAAGGHAIGFFADAVKGTAISFGVSTAKGRTKRALTGTVAGDAADEIPGASVKGGNGKASAKLVAPRSGRYFFVVASAAGDATGLAGSFSVKPPSKGKATVDALAPNGSFDVEIGVLAGATLAFSAKPDPKSGVALNVIAVFDPDGAAVPTAGLVVRKGATVSLNAQLAKSGTYVVRVKGTGENPTKLTYSYTVKQPKGVTYAAD